MVDDIRSHWRYQPGLKLVVAVLSLLTIALQIASWISHPDQWLTRLTMLWAPVYFIVSMAVPPRLWSMPIAIGTTALLTLELVHVDDNAFAASWVCLHVFMIALCLGIFYFPMTFSKNWFVRRGGDE